MKIETQIELLKQENERLRQGIEALAESHVRLEQTLRWLIDFSKQLREPKRAFWHILCECLKKFVEWDGSNGWLLGHVEKEAKEYRFSPIESSQTLD